MSAGRLDQLSVLAAERGAFLMALSDASLELGHEPRDHPAGECR
jgi:hypothetical protein